MLKHPREPKKKSAKINLFNGREMAADPKRQNPFSLPPSLPKKWENKALPPPPKHVKAPIESSFPPWNDEVLVHSRLHVDIRCILHITMYSCAAERVLYKEHKYLSAPTQDLPNIRIQIIANVLKNISKDYFLLLVSNVD